MVQTNNDFIEQSRGRRRYGRANHAREHHQQLVRRPRNHRSSRPQYNQPGHLMVASAGDNGGGVSRSAGRPRGAVHPADGRLRRRHQSGQDRCGQPARLARSRFGIRSRARLAADLRRHRQRMQQSSSSKPVWQHDAGCARRSAADLSAVASVYTPFAVYSVLFKAYPGHSPWAGFGGTSLSSPLIAGMFALAG